MSCLFNINANAQLGFCSGNSGDPIFVETFGSGTINNSLPIGTTTYPYASGYPNDGFYTVSNGTIGNGFDWHQTQDHTAGDTNGKCLIVNAAAAAGEFYRTTISGLCETTTYEFSAWVMNLVRANSFCSTQPGGTIPINVKFEIWDSTNTNLLATGDTGNIVETSNPNWQEYGLVFQTLPGQNDVILKMINNGQGGCGNDLAIDDIEFKSCGDTVAISANNNNVNWCSSQGPFTDTLTAIPDFTVFNSHFYQWQESADGILWNDMAGETSQNLSISVTATTYYRAKIAEVAINLNNPQCVIYSDEHLVTINQLPPMPTLACWEMATINTSTCLWDITGTQPVQPALECWQTATFNTVSCSWDVTGTQPVQPALECWQAATFNNTTCLWDITGTQPVQPALECWQTATFNTVSCSWDVTGTQPVQPVLECWQAATFNNTTCLWDITGTQPLQPALECWQTATFNTVSCSWDVTGTQPVQPVLECWQTATFNNTTCLWDITGTQPLQPILECWQTTTFNTVSCSWDVTGTQPGKIYENDLMLCENDILLLQANTNIPNPQYVWSTGDVSDEISIDTPGVYSVEVSGGICAFETRIFNVAGVETPIIETVISDGNDIIITTANSGDFLYSIDGNIFQSNNSFFNVKGGQYTIYVKERNCDGQQTLQHLHFYIPKYFTPNNDGIHDTFDLSGIEFYNSSEVTIYNRYGKLLKTSRNSSFSWDGTFNNQDLPSDDYWYVITIEGQKVMGHFALKR